MRIAIMQQDLDLRDEKNNAKWIIENYQQACQQGAKLVVVPEISEFCYQLVRQGVQVVLITKIEYSNEFVAIRNTTNYIKGNLAVYRTFRLKGKNIKITRDCIFNLDITNDIIKTLQNDISTDILIIPSANPYYLDKPEQRVNIAVKIAKSLNCYVIFANQIKESWGQLWDGRSFVVDPKGICVGKMDAFKEDIRIFDIFENEQRFDLSSVDNLLTFAY